VQEAARDVKKDLGKLLDQLKLCHQEDVVIGKHRLTSRVFSPFGVPYAIDIDALENMGMDEPLEALEAVIQRDEELLQLGYRVLHLGTEEIMGAPKDVSELVKRLV